LHTIISGLVFTYSPSELELYLLDCKQVEFKEYAKYLLPHSQVVAIHSGREYGLSVLKKLNEELEKREREFKTSDVKSLSKYLDIENKKMPRIVLIIDEFQELFSYDDGIARTAEQILDRLIRLGRALGIHVLLASQSLSGKNTISQTVVEQIAVRIALKLRSDNESRRVLSDGNDAARYLNRSGEAIYNDQNGLKEYNRRFQVYWFEEERRQDLLKRIRQKAESSEFFERRPIVFDGDAPAFIEDNRDLNKLISDTAWSILHRGHTVKTWLGAPTEIKPHTAALFKRQSSSNMHIIGEREYEERIIGIFTSSIISLASQQSPQRAQFVIFNVTDVSDSWHELPSILQENMPHEFMIITRDNAKSAIQKINDQLEVMKKEEDISAPSIYIAIFGIQYISGIRLQDKKLSSRSYFDKNKINESTEQSATEMLWNILRYGPEKGIHSLLWCNKYSELRQIVDGDIRELSDIRIIFQSSEIESRAIIDSDMATKLGPNRAILYDRQKSALEKFIPYEPPSSEWIASQGNKLRIKQGKPWN